MFYVNYISIKFLKRKNSSKFKPKWLRSGDVYQTGVYVDIKRSEVMRMAMFFSEDKQRQLSRCDRCSQTNGFQLQVPATLPWANLWQLQPIRTPWNRPKLLGSWGTPEDILTQWWKGLGAKATMLEASSRLFPCTINPLPHTAVTWVIACPSIDFFSFLSHFLTLWCYFPGKISQINYLYSNPCLLLGGPTQDSRAETPSIGQDLTLGMVSVG